MGSERCIEEDENTDLVELLEDVDFQIQNLESERGSLEDLLLDDHSGLRLSTCQVLRQRLRMVSEQLVRLLCLRRRLHLEAGLIRESGRNSCLED